MATRFYPSFSNAAPTGVTPAFDAGWEQTGQAIRRYLAKKATVSVVSNGSLTVTIPTTTTQDILAYQFISDPLPSILINGTFSLVAYCSESALTANASLAVLVKVVSNDGGTVRGTLFSNFNNDTEFVNVTSATRSVNAQAVTPLTAQSSDRLVVEVGVHAAAPAATTASIAFRDNQALTADYTVGGAQTNSLFNTWCELSADIWQLTNNNYQFVKVGDGMSTGEKIR